MYVFQKKKVQNIYKTDNSRIFLWFRSIKETFYAKRKLETNVSMHN